MSYKKLKKKKKEKVEQENKILNGSTKEEKTVYIQFRQEGD